MSDILLSGASGNVGGVYEISNSIMMDSADTPILSRTPSTAGDTKTFTVSAWFKRGKLVDSTFLRAGASASSYYDVFIIYSDSLTHWNWDAAQTDWMQSTAKQRDPASWIHVLLSYDSTQVDPDDRVKQYVNGVLLTEYDTANTPVVNTVTRFNSTELHVIGNENTTTNRKMDGYLAEYIIIDGDALTPSSFGEFHPNNDSVWRPIDPSELDFSGTNSCWLDFKDNTSATTLGYDVSGNGNHWTPTNISTTDQSTDTPTNNSCTLNPLWKSTMPLSSGNLTSIATTQNGRHTSTMALSSGKWYCEMRVDAGANHMLGVGDVGDYITNYPGQTLYSYGFHSPNGNKYNDETAEAYGSTTTTTGDIIMMAVDFDNNKIWWGKNNAWFASGVPSSGTNPAYTIASDREYFIIARVYNSTGTMRFHEDEFTYTPPTNFLPIMSKYLPGPTIRESKRYFDPVLYTGNTDTTRTISTRNKVDHVILKSIDGVRSWHVGDTVRGANKNLFWDDLDVENTDTNRIIGFGTTSGFDIGNHAAVNDSTKNFVAYPFTKSSIAGMDIVSYVGTGVARTVSHSLGVAPELMLVKNRDQADSWLVYFKSMGATKYLRLDTNQASETNIGAWNNTDPTSSVFSVGTFGNVNQSDDNIIAYLFASVEGFSKVFSYTGNGSADGPFVHCDFKPAFVMLKNSGVSQSWRILDIKRSPYNVAQETLFPDTSAVEANVDTLDFLSNGFKVRRLNTDVNGNGNQFVGIAFAEYPFALMNNSEL